MDVMASDPLERPEVGLRLAELQPDNLSMRVFESIQSAIKDKSLPPGKRVTEADLAAQLNVSKTPVREAFIKLRQIGLLEPDGRRAWRVIQLSRRTIDDACEVREALEVSAARAAAERATAEQRAAITDAAARSLTAARAGDKETFRSFDDRFHRGIAEGSGNARLRGLIDDTLLLIATLKLRDLPHRQASIECAQAHVAIAATIANHSTNAAGEAMRAHVQQVKEYTFGDVE
jgi:GntR family transcriptional regulator, rspAB operon transcriptional repressor